MRGACSFFLVLVACAEGTALTGGAGGDGALGGENSGASSAGAGGQGGNGAQAPGGAGPGGAGPGGSAPGGAGPGGAGGSGGAPVDDICAAGTFATGVDAAGKLVCVNPDTTVAPAMRAGCSVYWGMRDGCGGCSDPPAKWGRVSGDTCALGLGANNTCTAPSLGGTTVQLFGLNTDGDVDENDKFHIGFHCAAPPATPGACEPGDFMIGLNGAAPICLPAASFVVEAAKASCSLYAGWRDGCDGCSLPPAKWGRVATNVCALGTGVGDTCAMTVLGGETVNLLGVLTDGDVDGNDKFYMGMRCAPATAANSTAVGQCPAGQIVTGVLASGELVCDSPAPRMMDVASESCALRFGWIDGCGACTTAPTKWGRVGETTCLNGSGADNTCTTATLGVDSVQLFGLSTDGDVNDDDKFHIGFTCQ